mmetsp:Transcript_13383/g.41405  ORF Transcript_13383/g.41405 Transcript_13383/m.41405 type:complete len:174 (-) Transcript_13383:85-606(-)
MSDDYVEALVLSLRNDEGGMLNAEVLRVTVPRDQETGKDKGIAFVKVIDAAQAGDVAEGLDGLEFEGRVLNSNVKERRGGGKPKWTPPPPVDVETLDDGGLLAQLDGLSDRFAIQQFGLEQARNACKKAGIKAGGDLEQVTDRLLKIQGVKPEVYLDPAMGLVPTRAGKRNAW